MRRITLKRKWPEKYQHEKWTESYQDLDEADKNEIIVKE